MSKPQLVLVTALLLLTSGVAAQEQALNQTQDNVLGDDVIASNFVMRGLPGSSQEEVEADRSFEQEEDGDESFNLTEDEAVEIAREELGSSEWNLEDSERSEGLYEFEFVRGESEAEVSVDGSSGRIVEFEAEVEWEPENEEPSAVLSGFIQFSREGYEVDTDIEVDEENSEASFEVEIEQDEVGAEVINREEIREFEDAAPGSYTGRLEVVRDDEVVHREEQEFRVPGPTENESDEEESEDDDSEESEESEESLENMSREELIEEVRSLREQVQSLQNRIDSGRPESPGNRPDGIDNPEDESEDDDSEESEESEESENETEDEENETEETESEDETETDSDDSEESEESENETEDEENETEETESENETETDSDDSEESGPPTGAPGNSDQRPGFVNRMLSGIFS